MEEAQSRHKADIQQMPEEQTQEPRGWFTADILARLLPAPAGSARPRTGQI